MLRPSEMGARIVPPPGKATLELPIRTGGDDGAPRMSAADGSRRNFLRELVDFETAGATPCLRKSSSFAIAATAGPADASCGRGFSPGGASSSVFGLANADPLGVASLDASFCGRASSSCAAESAAVYEIETDSTAIDMASAATTAAAFSISLATAWLAY